MMGLQIVDTASPSDHSIAKVGAVVVSRMSAAASAGHTACAVSTILSLSCCWFLQCSNII